MAQHLATLADPELPHDIGETYTAMSQAAVQRALGMGTLSEAKAAELLDLLSEES